MKRTALLILLLSTTILGISAAGLYDTFVTVADVQKVSGLTGVKIVPKDPSKGAGGDLNFADKDGNLILMVLFQDVKLFAQSKALKNYNKGSIQGVGQEAFYGPVKDPQHMLIFKQKTYCVTLSTYFDFLGTQPTRLTIAQLTALAKIIVPRL